MTREFVWTSAFLRGWERCGFAIDDLTALEQALLEDPKAEKVIQGTGGARKFRFAFERRGKAVPPASSMWTLRSGRKYAVSRHILKQTKAP